MRVLLLLFFLALVIQETEPVAQPEVQVDVGVVEPNRVSVIRVTVTNPNTADKLWGNVLRIEESHPYFVPLQSEYTLSDEILPGSTDIGELTFHTTRDAEAGVYPIVISLSGGVGPCEEGCVPYLIEKEIQITIIRNSPDIEISHVVQGPSVVVTISNRGSGKAKAIVCDGVTIPLLLPGESEEIVIAKENSFTVEYEDEYGKRFLQAHKVSDSEPKDSSFQTGLVLIGIGAEYLFKKKRN